MTELEQRQVILNRILECIAANRTIHLSDEFIGQWHGYRYTFEGEDDLLHLAIEKADGAPLSVEEAQGVVADVLAGVPPSLIWLKPGFRSHHFYLGHDDMVDTIIL
jgi:hypothetical protein